VKKYLQKMTFIYKKMISIYKKTQLT